MDSVLRMLGSRKAKKVDWVHVVSEMAAGSSDTNCMIYMTDMHDTCKD